MAVGSQRMLGSAPSIRGLAAATLVLLPGACAPAAEPTLHLRAEASRRVNAIYHLACLARSISCTHQVFERFWRGPLGWTPADQAALDEWRQVMADVTDRAPPRSGAPLLLNTPRFHPAQAARGLVFVAAVESRSARELVSHSSGILSTQAAARLAAAVAHFERRLDPWWRSESRRRRAVDGQLKRVADHARRTGMLQVMADVAAFVEAELVDPELRLHAIIPPEPTSQNFTATQSGKHFFVEAVSAATTDAFVHGAVHELSHYLYDRAPSGKHVALVREFAQSEATSFAGLYTYLNEALAVAAQGLYADRQKQGGDESEGYKHPYIQPLGAVTIPLLKDAITRQQTLFSDFAASYIAAGTAALGSKVREPRFVLAQVALLVPPEADRLTAAYSATMFPQASAQFQSPAELEAFPDVNVVWFVQYEALDSLAAQIPELVSLRARRAFAFAIKRGPRAYTYILAGRDTDSIVEVITKLGALERLPAAGLLFALD